MRCESLSIITAICVHGRVHFLLLYSRGCASHFSEVCAGMAIPTQLDGFGGIESTGGIGEVEGIEGSSTATDNGK